MSLIGKLFTYILNYWKTQQLKRFLLNFDCIIFVLNIKRFLDIMPTERRV